MYKGPGGGTGLAATGLSLGGASVGWWIAAGVSLVAIGLVTRYVSHRRHSADS
ncbi:peptidase [Pseudonocardiaceae bacterium YIM PH 21723]|nr:peptidase [Pseudonocardiaceae bacterium YIM PH 21723]